MACTLDDDRCEDRWRDVLAACGVVDDEGLFVLDHAGRIFRGHIAVGGGSVEPLVGMSLDCDRRCEVGHA
jgi:hypothetical protein